jgi:2-dehydropantoate 2-reductase
MNGPIDPGPPEHQSTSSSISYPLQHPHRTTMPPSPQPIHILGLGNVAKLLAHSLRRSQTSSANAQAHNPVINLIFHRESLFPEWKQAAESIEITREGICDRQTGFHVKTLQQPLGQLSNVIVTTKTHATVAALRGLKKAGTLGPWSTFLFTQNGIVKFSCLGVSRRYDAMR